VANWLTLSKIEQWKHLVFLGFQYDDVTDDEIFAALNDQSRLACVDCHVEWQDDGWLAGEATIPNERKHAYRVASIVRALDSGNVLLKAISLDTFSAGRCRSAVGDGHHRIRALQYLGLDCAPFSLGGVISQLNELVRLAGTTCPEFAQRYFSKELLAPAADDIKPRKKKAVPQQVTAPTESTFTL
jgi:hypothetical protein